MAEIRNRNHLSIEILVRLMLGFVFLVLEYAEPFQRKLQPEELWLYKNPRATSYVPTYMLWPIICVVPFFVIFAANMIIKQKGDGFQAFLGLTLAYGINGVVTNAVKLVVGRPRPDFFFRCFPNGEGSIDQPCTGDKADIIEGLKSFPSGHSSFAFASMMYCTLYLCGKLQVFTSRGRGEAWRLTLCICPMFIGLLIALSRTCDYHHHWQDVSVGSIFGIFIAWLCYAQYYPPITHPNCATPYSIIPEESLISNQLKKSDSLEDVTVKWI